MTKVREHNRGGRHFRDADGDEGCRGRERGSQELSHPHEKEVYAGARGPIITVRSSQLAARLEQNAMEQFSKTFAALTFVKASAGSDSPVRNSDYRSTHRQVSVGTIDSSGRVDGGTGTVSKAALVIEAEMSVYSDIGHCCRRQARGTYNFITQQGGPRYCERDVGRRAGGDRLARSWWHHRQHTCAVSGRQCSRQVSSVPDPLLH